MEPVLTSLSMTVQERASLERSRVLYNEIRVNRRGDGSRGHRRRAYSAPLPG